LFALLLSLCVSTVSFAQVDPRTGILEQSGFKALNAGDARRAADAFHEAISADPKNARLYLGAGVAAWLLRQDEEAQVALEHALELDPDLIEARLYLGQVHYRRGDLPAAIEAYELLARSAPDHADEIGATLDRWRHELDLQTGMRQAVGNHFTVSYEGPAEAEFGSKALESLDKAYWRVGQVLGVYPATSIPVILYTAEQFRDITRSPSWAAGAYDGRIRLPMRGALTQTDELDRVLAHEFTHALIRSLCPRAIPTWLNEGLATALETGDLAWARSHAMAGTHRLPLSSLDGSFANLSGAQAEVAYAASALAAARLLEAAGGVAVANLIRDLADGVEFDAAFARRMPWTFSDFTANFSQ
jgi:tetratricopeptide (TPR) repeat protein